MNDLELKLKISASAADAIAAFGDLKKSLTDISAAVAAAQAKTADLAREFNSNREKAEALRVQYALGQRALDDLAQSAGKTSPEYRALQAEIKQMAADLKAADAATAQSEKAFAAAQREAGQLKDKLDAMRQATHQHREALRAQGVDVGNLAQEYLRLKREAEAANAAQSQKTAIAQDREALGLNPHADTQARIAAIHAAVERLRASGSLTFAEMAQAELKADQLAQDLTHELNGVGDSLSALQGDLIEFGAALAAVYATADQAIKFESGFAGVSKVVDASTGKLAALSDELLKMTRSLPNAASEMLDIAESAGSLGIAADEVGAFTEGVAKLSSAFKMQAKETADYAAGIKNGFGLNVDQVLELGDAVNTLGNKYAATENDILNVDARIAASAKTFGLSAEQSSALATTLLSLKNPPEVAATAINGLLSRLQSVRVQSPEFQKALKAIGVDANQLAGDIAAHPQQALDGFLETLSKLDNTSLAEATNQLIGQGGDATALQQLVQNRKQYAEAVNTATDKTQTAGAVEREFAAQMATTDAQLKLVKNSVVELAVNVGNTLLPAITGGANASQTFINALADAAKANPELAKLLVMFTPLIAGAGLLNGIGLRLAVMWGTVTAAFTAGGAASVAMSGGLGTVLTALLRLIGGPIGLLILALTTLADWWGRNKEKEVAWGDESVTVAEIVRTAWGYLMRAAGALGDYLAGQFGKMGLQLDGYAQSVKDAVNFVIGVFAGLGNGIGEGLAVFVEDVRRYFDQAVKLAQAAGKDIKAAVRLDFSGANVKAQWAANGQENRAAEARQNGAGFSHGLGVAFDDPSQGAAGQAVKSVVFKTGQAVNDWVTQWRGEFRAQMAKDKAQADAEADAKKSNKDQNGNANNGGTGGSGQSGNAGGGTHINWDAGDVGGGGSSGGKGTGAQKKTTEQITRDEIDALNLGLAERKQVFEKTNLLLEFGKKEEKAYWDEVIVDYKGSSATLTQIKQKSAQLDVEILREDAQRQQQTQAELSQAQQSAALADLDFKRQMADQKLELGEITKQKHLERLKELAAEELALRLKILKDERKLHPNDQVEQARITTEQQQVMIEFRGKWQGLDLTGLKNDQEAIKGLFAPLQNAIDQSINGILTGQQTISNAARNAAQSIVVSYLQQSIKTRAIAAADWLFQHTGMAKLLADKKQFDLLETAWDAAMWVRKRVAHTLQWTFEITGLAGLEARKRAIKQAGELWNNLIDARKKAKDAALWIWEALGFSQKEAAKSTATVTAAAAQTGAEVTKDVVTTASHVTATATKDEVTKTSTLKTVFMAAKQAAAFTYQSVSAIPFVGWALAPIAALVAFGAVMAFGSAKGGEYYVDGDDKPYLLHKKESVLPAGVADNFRTVVNIVRDYAAPKDVANEKQSEPATTERVAGGKQATAQIGQWTSQAASYTVDAVSRRGETISTAVGHTVDAVSRRIETISTAVGNTVDAVSRRGETISTAVGNTVDAVSRRIETISTAAGHTVETAKLATAKIGQWTSQAASHTVDAVSRRGETISTAAGRNAGTTLPANVGEIVQGLQASGRLATDWQLPRDVVTMAQDSQHSAQALAKNAYQKTTQNSAPVPAAHASPAPARSRDELHIHTASAEEFFSKNSRVFVKQLGKEARRFNKGTS